MLLCFIVFQWVQAGHENITDKPVVNILGHNMLQFSTEGWCLGDFMNVEGLCENYVM
jgi:hypothetical protein